MHKKLVLIVTALLLTCGGMYAHFSAHGLSAFHLNPEGKTIETRLKLPEGYERIGVGESSFGAYLRKLPLKPHGSRVTTYQGNISPNDAVAAAVIDIPVGRRDLLQCADAVMRLRADYLFAQKRANTISFNFVSGFRCDYASYAAGNRFSDGRWKKTAQPDASHKAYLSYLDLVYSYASTLSLEKELKPVKSMTDLAIGDVFIRGGSPGHCFIVVDMARDRKTGEKVFAIAQGFMPAQDIHIIKERSGSVWLKPSKSYEYDFAYGELIAGAYLRRFAGEGQ